MPPGFASIFRTSAGMSPIRARGGCVERSHDRNARVHGAQSARSRVTKLGDHVINLQLLARDDGFAQFLVSESCKERTVVH